jgi:hypothetical protein
MPAVRPFPVQGADAVAGSASAGEHAEVQAEMADCLLDQRRIFQAL